ncbi:purine nucleosidase, partial [Staphylococcus aureus]|nr:purine nucleosidase [Staphylococcus aureus]
TLDVRQRWANERQYTGIDFLGVSYAAVPPLTHFITNSTYFLWDVLTTAYIGNKDLVHSIEKKVDVISYGPSQGKTFECKDGRKINVINHVDNNAFFDYITALAKKVN